MEAVSGKRMFDSAVLGRSIHLDVHDLGSGGPLVLLFGGSALGYDRYAQSLRPEIAEFVARGPDFALRLVYYQPSPALPFARLGEDATLLDRWVAHVTGELLPMVSRAPNDRIVLASHSGGARLAFAGLHDGLLRCAGGVALGADGIPRDFARPIGWKEPLHVIYTEGDALRARNDELLSELEDLDRVDVEECVSRKNPPFRDPHVLEAYVKWGGLTRLMRHATRLGAS